MSVPVSARFRSNWTRLTSFVVCLACFVAGGHAQGKQAPPPTAVTSSVHNYSDSSPTGQLLLLRSDGIDSAQYSSDGTGVLSQIYSVSGDWEIELRNQNARTVYLTFSDGWTPVGNTSRPPDGNYPARVLSRCFDANNNITGFLAIVPGTSNNRCSLRVEFTYGGIQYVFVMSPAYAGTGSATVSCTSGNFSNVCVSWTIVPTPPSLVGNATTANLYSVARSGKETLIGSAHNTYRIDVTNP